MSVKLRALEPSNHDLVDAGFVATLCAVALYAFRSSFGGVQFMVPATIAVLLGITVAHVAQRLQLDPLLTAAATFVMYLLVVGTLALRDRATAGFLPSVDTLRDSLTLIVSGWKRLLTTSPPVGSRSGLTVVPAVCGIVAGSVAYSVARRTRSSWIALVPIFATMALGLLCGLEHPVSVVLHGAVITAGSIAWIAVRHQWERPAVHHVSHRSRAFSAAVMLVVVAGAGLVVGPKLPMVDATDRVVWRSQLSPPFDPMLYPSPLNGYRRYLKALKDQPLFTISGVPDGVPVRLATMDVYDGLVWRVSGSTDGTSGLFQRVGDRVPNDFPGKTATIHVVIDKGFPADSVWLPTVGEVRSLRFGGPRAQQLTDSFRYNHTTDTAAMPLGLQEHDEYTMEVTLPTLESQIKTNSKLDVIPQLRADVLAIDSVTSFGANLPTVANEKNPIRRAIDLADEFRKSGFYNDPTKTDGSLPSGHGASRLDRFVKGKNLVGDGEQYAATAGLIAAEYKVPVRVVMGFSLGAVKNPTTPVTVVGTKAEAWIEVPVAGIGWVGLVTTPDRTQIEKQVDQQQNKVPDRQTQVPPPPANIVPDAPVNPASAAAGKKERSKEQKAALNGNDGGLPILAIGGLIALVPLSLFAAAVGLIVALKVRRQRRRRLAGAPNQRIANGWRELLDSFRDMGRPLPAVATRREAAAFTGAPVGHLAERADRAIFGPGEPSDEEVESYWSEIDTTVRGLHGSLSFRDRWKAKLSLTSLLTREKNT